jgi:hypothetical protein
MTPNPSIDADGHRLRRVRSADGMLPPAYSVRSYLAPASACSERGRGARLGDRSAMKVDSPSLLAFTSARARESWCVKSYGAVAETMMEAERQGHGGDETGAPRSRGSAPVRGEVVPRLQRLRQRRKASSPSRLLSTLNASASLDRRQRSTSASLRCVVRYTAGSHHCQPECSWLSRTSPASH